MKVSGAAKSSPHSGGSARPIVAPAKLADGSAGPPDYIGLFAVTAGIGVEKRERQFEATGHGPEAEVAEVHVGIGDQLPEPPSGFNGGGVGRRQQSCGDEVVGAAGPVTVAAPDQRGIQGVETA
jgi:hypothetical protein